MGDVDGLISLFACVVRRSRLLTGGKRSSIVAVRSSMLVSAASGSDSVCGRPRPGKVVMRTLIIAGAILYDCIGRMSV